MSLLSRMMILMLLMMMMMTMMMLMMMMTMMIHDKWSVMLLKLILPVMGTELKKYCMDVTKIQHNTRRAGPIAFARGPANGTWSFHPLQQSYGSEKCRLSFERIKLSIKPWFVSQFFEHAPGNQRHWHGIKQTASNSQSMFLMLVPKIVALGTWKTTKIDHKRMLKPRSFHLFGWIFPSRAFQFIRSFSLQSNGFGYPVA